PFEDLRKGPWLDALRGFLTHQQWQAIEREAPERIEVPSGSRIALKYELGRPPILAVRIQELFGLGETPRIAGGRVRVLLHLLARQAENAGDAVALARARRPAAQHDRRHARLIQAGALGQRLDIDLVLYAQVADGLEVFHDSAKPQSELQSARRRGQLSSPT